MSMSPRGLTGLALFVGLSTTRKERMYDIEFLGGTSLQIDLKPGVTMTDEEAEEAFQRKQDAEDAAQGGAA